MSRLEALTEKLRAARLVAADAPPLEVDDSGRPWFVSLLLGAAGWLAGLMLIFFIGITFRMTDGLGLAILGLFLMGAAYGLYRVDVGGAFLGQLALAFSIAGQIAFAFGLLQDANSALVVSGTLLLLQIGVFVLMPNRTARAIAMLFAGIVWCYFVRFAVYPDSDWEGWFMPDQKNAQFGAASAVVTWAITWVPLVAAALWLLKRETWWMSRPLRAWFRPALTGLLVVLALGGQLTEPFATLMFGPDRWGMQFGWWSLFPLLSIGIALFAAWCAFRLRNLGLMGVGLFGALLHVSRFYYIYGTTLLEKSLIMLVLGVLLLVTAWWLRERGSQS